MDSKDSTSVLKNLQTLSTIINFRCSEDVLERIPNLKKLIIWYRFERNKGIDWSFYSLQNLGHLQKLESLYLHSTSLNWKKVSFPHTLRKLTLSWCGIPRKNMMIIGSLPNLEVLKLLRHPYIRGLEWNPVEGEFHLLKLLSIEQFKLQWWRAEKVHFPNLETLVLQYVDHLKKIPSGIGEIEMLRSIYLDYCKDSIVDSAKEKLADQQSLGNEGLQLHVNTHWE